MGGMPGINMKSFGVSFIKRRASRSVSELIDKMGPVAIKKILDSGKPLSDLLPAEKLQQYKAMAHKYAWIANAITDQELVAMIPPWALEMVANKGPEGNKWLQDQITWLRSLFT